jgi:WD40 repeat protein
MKKKWLSISGSLIISSQLLFPFSGFAEEQLDDRLLDFDSTPIIDENVLPPTIDFVEGNDSQFTKIGALVKQKTALTAAYGEGPDQTPYMYVIQHGTPSALTVVNLTTGKTEETLSLGESTSAWGIDVDENHHVWVGGTSNGNIYQYNPFTKEFKNHGNKLQHKSDTSIQDLDASDGKIFGSTAYDGTVFSYNPSTNELKDYGQVMLGKEFAKSVYYDAKQESLFIGIGSKAELTRYDINKNVLSRFLPFKYSQEKYVSDIQVVEDYLFAQLDPSKKVLVFNKNTLEFLDEFDVSSKTVSRKSPLGDHVFFTKNSDLYTYNYTTKEKTKLDVPLKGNAISLDFVQLNTTDYPGATLVGLTSNSGEYFKYNLETGHFEMSTVDLSKIPVTLYTMATNPMKDKIIINGYMSGGLGIYDVKTGSISQIDGISQVESMIYFNNKVYFGAYPNARILEFDLGATPDKQSLNEILRFEDVGQERPTALLGVEDADTIFIGSYPETSVGGGLLSTYNPFTKENVNYANYIPNQSIIALAYLKGYVYGGTTIFANHQASKEGAKFFRFPANNPELKEMIELPFKSSLISALVHNSGETIWGVANGTLFSYNIVTKETKSNEIVASISGRFKNAELLFGTDGKLYGSVEGILFEANPETLHVTVLKKEGAHDLAIDHKGDLYYRHEADLWKYDQTKEHVVEF